MAAGAAHELNNPLAIVSGRAQLMAAKAAGEEDRKVWSLISQQAQRMSDIISDLMSFASPPPPQPGEIDPAELLSQAAERLRSSDEAQVRSSKVDITVSQGAASLWADREQVLGVLGESDAQRGTCLRRKAGGDSSLGRPGAGRWLGDAERGG